MSEPLSAGERRALGVRARKQLPRSAHGAFDAAACAHDPLELLRQSMNGRVASLVPVKYERMAASPFGFFRGAVPVMAADLACQPNTGVTTQLCGDAHVVNLGAYAGFDGRLVFDLNDFDETIQGPFEWDIKRMATSLLLAGREAGVGRARRRAAVAAFTARYRGAMREFATMPVLELARFQVHRLGHMEPMPAILRMAERSTPQKLVEKLTELVPAEGAKAGAAKRVRRFKQAPPLLERLQPQEAQLVLDALGPYARTLLPERRHFLAQYSPVDVAFKVVGTGSVGLRDYCVYMEGSHLAAGVEARAGMVLDPLFLQIKEEPTSAYAHYLPEGAVSEPHQGHRVADGQRAMQLTSDPFLGYTTIAGRDYLVRQLNDHKASLDLKTLNAAGLLGYAEICGDLMARGHARAGDPVAIAAYLGNSDRFDVAILEFARTYANKTEKDWARLRKWWKAGGK